MTGQMDHAAEAEAILGSIRAGLSADMVAAAVAGAQVHATLALVEQQRIANLIALAGLRVEFGNGSTVSTSLEGVLWMRAQAESALGVPKHSTTRAPARVRAGDPDPTPDVLHAAESRCGAAAPRGRGRCTWPRGHLYEHVFGDGEIAVEVWS